MGRKKLPDDERREKPFRIRLSPSERAIVDAAAKAAGSSSSDWARELLIKAASKRKPTLDKPDS